MVGKQIAKSQGEECRRAAQQKEPLLNPGDPSGGACYCGSRDCLTRDGTVIQNKGPQKIQAPSEYPKETPWKDSESQR